LYTYISFGLVVNVEKVLGRENVTVLERAFSTTRGKKATQQGHTRQQQQLGSEEILPAEKYGVHLPRLQRLGCLTGKMGST
jgi:hypothetical protein